MAARLLLPLLLVALLAVALAVPGMQSASWERLSALLLALQSLAAVNPAAATAAYTLLYFVMIACCVPMAPAMGVGGGAILGPVLGTVCAASAATAGSVAVMLLSRRLLAPKLAPKHRTLIERLRPLLERNGLVLVLTLRLTILTPSWLINIAAGLAGMRVAPFAVATLAGILPATIVFASLGASLGEALTSEAAPGLGLVLRPGVLGPLAALTLIALVPLAFGGRLSLRALLR